MSSLFDLIIFDADDTLWHNLNQFWLTQDRFVELLSPYHDKKSINDRLYETEMRNMAHFGYGVKAFGLSMIETAIELSEGRIQGHEIKRIIDYCKEMLDDPIDLLPNVADTIHDLHHKYPLMIITKGDLLDQENKIARSGLADFFTKVEIVSNKTAETYAQVFAHHNLNPERLLMVGNSVKSDVLPIIEVGGRAVHIPYHTTWEHEMVDMSHIDEKPYYELDDIAQLPDFLEKLEQMTDD